MSKTRILFDTNVLVYAHDTASRYHSDSAALLLQAFQQNIQGVLAEQNIIELYRILTNSVAMTGNALTPQQAQTLIKSTYLNGSFEVIYPNFSTIDRLLDLAVIRNITSAKIFDLRLAALVLESQIDHFATYNLRDFQQINHLNAIDPPSLLALLGL
ncbi:PIN domain-containing protein [Leptolyngbya sp. DQ-M1]|uniref:type II toxin-antitoxin system VapC family toxin n=1 Tax=Leptolyngbya sp. DQ-M1 TaxID=2933920 RepID=UPI00329A21E3